MSRYAGRTSGRWPDRSDPLHFSTPSRCGPSSPPRAASQGGGTSPAGLFRPTCGPEVHGLPIGSRAEPSPTRVRDGSLCAQEIWPATLSQPGCETVGRGAGDASAAAACEPWPYAVGAGRARGTTPRAPATRTARFESPAAGEPPTPFELLGLPAHLLQNKQVAQLSAEATPSRPPWSRSPRVTKSPRAPPAPSVRVFRCTKEGAACFSKRDNTVQR